MIPARLVLAITLLSPAGLLYASPALDLSSPSQAVRDAAALLIRARYVAPARTNWESLLSTIQVGDSATNVWQVLRPLKVTTKKGRTVEGEYLASYRLDDRWVLSCTYQTPGNMLKERELREDWRYAQVPPPKAFSGVWVTYWINGQKREENYYTNGIVLEERWYSPEGAKSGVWQHGPNGLEDVTMYFRSGRIQRHTHDYQTNGVKGTISILYNEDASTNSLDVRQYFPSGRTRVEEYQPNGAPGSVLIEYNEDGSTNRVVKKTLPR